ncbi:helix-turn-helix domain-containing protein [Anaerobacillus sp. MEB173]|uniref:helix-turn-helix domain-containing protein n=1 Tax=Anaerobacillus sp. MEB173 TaxID=3383345 RepID=UPI003F93713D
MFSEILKSLRMERNLTKKAISDYLEITPQAYGHYENGKREPDFKTLIKLADFFNVPVDFLVGRKYEDLVEDHETIFFINAKGLTKEDIETVEKHIEFLRYQANEHNKKNK